MLTAKMFFYEFIVLVLTIAAITKICIPGTSLKNIIQFSWRRLLRRKDYRIYFLSIIGVVLIAAIESSIDKYITVYFKKHYTYIFYNIEGLFSFSLQQFQSFSLTLIMAYCYVIIFPALLIITLILCLYYGRKDTMFKMSFFIVLNYVLAFPFYVLFPINEVWVDYSPLVQPLLFTIDPYLLSLFKYTNGINNCFPSLHVSLSLSVFIISLSLPNKKYRVVSFICSCLIVLSTLYLGIHWLIDVIGGVVLVILINILYFFYTEKMPHKFLSKFKKKQLSPVLAR